MESVWARLEEISQSRFTGVRPDGGFTTGEYASRQKPPIDRTTAIKRLESLEREGLVERCGIATTHHGGRTIVWRLRDSQT